MRNLNLELFELPELLEMLERYMQIIEHCEPNDDEITAIWLCLATIETRRQQENLGPRLVSVGAA
jgi:hypothetical protein